MGQTISQNKNGRQVTPCGLLDLKARECICEDVSTVTSDDSHCRNSGGSSSGSSSGGNSRPYGEVAVAAIRSVHRFFEGLDDDLNMSSFHHRPESTLINDRDTGISPPAIAIVIRNRAPSRPVKCPPRSKEPLACGMGHNADASWDDTDDNTEDVQYLKRLYEMRTWDMYVRITEARKRQKYKQKGRQVQATGAPLKPETELRLLEEPHTASADLSPSHEMIFSCDLD